MKIDTKKVLVNLKGTPLKDEGNKNYTLGEAVAEMLINHVSGGKMKTFVLANRFMSEAEVDLDSADMILVKTAVDESTVYKNNLIAGQILIYLEQLSTQKPVDAKKKQR